MRRSRQLTTEAVARRQRRGCHVILLIALAALVLFSGGYAPHSTVSPVRFAVAAAAASPADLAIPSSSPPITETELIAIDLGHENMKIAAWRVQEEDVAIRPGGTGTVTATTTATTGAVTMVLNDQTNRKSPPCVAFRHFKAPLSPQNNNPQQQPHAEEADQDAQNPLCPPGHQLERTFAEQAQALAPRFPTQVVCSPAQLLGYTMQGTSAASPEHPYALTSDQLTAAYSFHVRPLHASTGSERPSLGVFVPFGSTSATTAATTAAAPAGTMYSAEELTAMLLGYARRMAEKADAADNALSEDEERSLMELINQSSTTTAAEGGNADASPPPRQQQQLRRHAAPRYAALTVPVHFTVAQRQALIDAAALAGLRVTRLVHSTTGAAVQLAYMKAEQVLRADKEQYVMLYDMGSQQAEVAIYRFSTMPATATARRVPYQGSVELKALVGSRTLGGAAFDECIAAEWDTLFFEQHILSGVRRATSEEERRTAAKQRGSLLRAAHRAKEMLSVNQDAHITIDGVHADSTRFNSAAQDLLQRHVVSVTPEGVLTLRYSRRQFELQCQSLFDAAVALRDEAVAATNGLVASVGALDRFEVIGGGTRVPWLLQRLSEGYGASGGLVDRTLNSDEASVLGTTLLAVAAAPRSLGLRARQTLPQYRIREWLTNAVYVALQAGEEEATMRPLFPAIETMVPAVRSVRVRLSTSGSGDGAAATVQDTVRVSLYSGAEADAAYTGSSHGSNRVGSTNATAEGQPVAVPACLSCYAQAYTVHGVEKAKAALQAQLERQYKTAVVALEQAEVVVEAVVTVSGVPHCSAAYLRTEFRVTPAAGGAAKEDEDGDKDAAAGAAAENANTTANETPAGVDAEGEDDEAGDDTQQASPTTSIPATAATAEDGADAQQDQQQQTTASPSSFSVVRVAPLSLAHAHPTSAAPSNLKHHYNMDRGELLRAHQRVRRLQAMDDVRLRRSTLRNDVESFIAWIKEQPAWDAEDAAAAAIPGLAANWRDTVREVGEWLDDFGETADVATLEERVDILRAMKLALRAIRE